jgi:thiamine-phosphate pyrophosphorylase
MIVLPRLYPILDASCFSDTVGLIAAAEELASAGVTVIQYRNKFGNARVMLEQTRELRRNCRTEPALSLPKGVSDPHVPKLVMNDRADLCLLAGFDGVHVGQDDLSPEAVRGIVGVERWLGVSTHNPEQVRQADGSSADYVAIGPVFSTASKDRPDPVVGLEGVRRARQLTRKPLVAIGGITRDNAASVIEAGADSVAVISDLLRDPRKSAEEFFRVLR